MENHTVDELIERAALSKSDEDYNNLFNKLRGGEVFFNLTDSEKPTVPMVDVGEGMKAIVFYVSSKDSRLTNRYGGIAWQKGLQMASKMKNLDGVVIQGISDSWVAISQKTISNMIE